MIVEQSTSPAGRGLITVFIKSPVMLYSNNVTLVASITLTSLGIVACQHVFTTLKSAGFVGGTSMPVLTPVPDQVTPGQRKPSVLRVTRPRRRAYTGLHFLCCRSSFVPQVVVNCCYQIRSFSHSNGFPTIQWLRFSPR